MMWPWTTLAAIQAQLATVSKNVNLLLTQESKLMNKIDDLNAAVSQIAANVAQLDTEVQTAVAAITAAVAADDTPAIEAAVASLSKASTTVAADTANLATALTPPKA
jgi:vacuolar-type H+-ATPase subunit D/Vma8